MAPECSTKGVEVFRFSFVYGTGVSCIFVLRRVFIEVWEMPELIMG